MVIFLVKCFDFFLLCFYWYFLCIQQRNKNHKQIPLVGSIKLNYVWSFSIYSSHFAILPTIFVGHLVLRDKRCRGQNHVTMSKGCLLSQVKGQSGITVNWKVTKQRVKNRVENVCTCLWLCDVFIVWWTLVWLYVLTWECICNIGKDSKIFEKSLWNVI